RPRRGGGRWGCTLWSGIPQQGNRGSVSAPRFPQRSPPMSKHHLVPLAYLALFVAACSSDTVSPTPPEAVVAKVDVAASASTMNAVGATVTLTATARDQNGDVVSGVTPTWTSSNPAVVNVDASGKATAVANGTAAVSAKVGQVSGQVTLNVQQVVVAVAVEPETWSPTALGSTQQFEAIARDAL